MHYFESFILGYTDASNITCDYSDHMVCNCTDDYETQWRVALNALETRDCPEGMVGRFASYRIAWIHHAYYTLGIY